MNDKNEVYRANAIRVLCRIIESSMLAQIERYLKQCIVVKVCVFLFLLNYIFVLKYLVVCILFS
jgi:hypothetical protein